MRLRGKAVRLDQLEAELVAAGVTVNGLGTAGDELHTYDADGTAIDLPSGADMVLAGHVPADPITGLTRDERLLAAVDQATEVVQASSAFTSEQKAILTGVFAGLGSAISGESA